MISGRKEVAMIQNLDVLSFAPFGRIQRDRNRANQERIPEGIEQMITITAPDTRGFTTRGPLLLDFDSGMAVLAVMAEDETFQFFYLDKPVWLNTGIRFALLPYQLSCTVRMLVVGELWPEETELSVSVRDLVMSRRLQVERVYTFFYHDKESGFFFRGESHSMLELTYVDKGSFHSVAGGQDLLLEQGDVAIYGPEQWHMQYADPGCAPSYITITFDLTGESLQHLLNRKFRMPERGIRILKQMLKERDNEDPYTSDMLISLLSQLLLTILRGAREDEHIPLRTDNSINSENEMVSRAQKYISDNVRTKLSVPMLAKAVGVSTSYLTALFHKNLQISPGEYIRRAKLQESKIMIREGKLNFTEISRQLQYSTVHHFSRQFKEKFGITPTEYARSIR